MTGLFQVCSCTLPSRTEDEIRTLRRKRPRGLSCLGGEKTRRYGSRDDTVTCHFGGRGVVVLGVGLDTKFGFSCFFDRLWDTTLSLTGPRGPRPETGSRWWFIVTSESGRRAPVPRKTLWLDLCSGKTSATSRVINSWGVSGTRCT